MTAKVYEFKKPDGGKPHHRKTDVPDTVKSKTNAEIFQDTQEDILGDWQRHAVKNQLREYFESKLPISVCQSPGADYINDLTVLASTEQRLEMKVVVFSPGATPNNLYGWLAAFHHNKEIFSTPPDMASEANARALNILLYLAFTRHMHSLGRE